MARLSHADVSAARACAVPVLGLQAAPTAWVPTSRSLTVRPSAGDCPHSRTLAQSQEITPLQVDKVELDELWLRKLILAGPRVDGCGLCWACPVSVGFARSVTGTLLWAGQGMLQRCAIRYHSSCTWSQPALLGLFPVMAHSSAFAGTSGSWWCARPRRFLGIAYSLPGNWLHQVPDTGCIAAHHHLVAPVPDRGHWNHDTIF